MLARLKQRALAQGYRRLAKPLFFRMDPERIHDLMTSAGHVLGNHRSTRLLVRRSFDWTDPRLRQRVAGIEFERPVGLSAGFDKDGYLVGILGDVGFGFTQVGSVTLRPYAGNPPPRLHRLPESEALIVYYGLKNEGAPAILRRLQHSRSKLKLSISIAKTNDEAAATIEGGIRDYRETLEMFNQAGVGDFYTLNISCPNTFGGEPFTTPDRLEQLLAALPIREIDRPVFLKMPVDLAWEAFSPLLDVAVAHGVTGVIIANLTKDRDSPELLEAVPVGLKGGISGRPTGRISTDLIRHTYAEYGHQLVIIGVGGVFSAEDAYAKIRAGASLVQLITGMIYRGPQLVGEINRGLVRSLQRDGFMNISEAVGADHR